MTAQVVSMEEWIRAQMLRNVMRRNRRSGSLGSHKRMLGIHRALYADKAPGGNWCPGALERGHKPHEVTRPNFLTIDHIVPKAAGGSNKLDNKRVLCSLENAAKGSDVPEGNDLVLARSTRLAGILNAGRNQRR